MKHILRSTLTLVTVVTLGIGMTACAATTSDSANSSSSSAESASTMASAVSVTDVWVKSMDDVSGVMPMTGFFMLVTNDSDSDVTITGGSIAADYSAEPLETHEVVKNDAGEMVMQEASSGILVPARSSVKLMPGSYHLMVMNLLKPIPTGDDVQITLAFADGSTTDVVATAYTIENGKEKYAPEAGN